MVCGGVTSGFPFLCLCYTDVVAWQEMICGLSVVHCSVVPVTEFDWMTLGAPLHPELWFCWKLFPSDSLFISILDCCLQSSSRLLPWKFPSRYTVSRCRGFSCTPGLTVSAVSGFLSFNKLPPGAGV